MGAFTQFWFLIYTVADFLHFFVCDSDKLKNCAFLCFLHEKFKFLTIWIRQTPQFYHWESLFCSVAFYGNAKNVLEPFGKVGLILTCKNEPAKDDL